MSRDVFRAVQLNAATFAIRDSPPQRCANQRRTIGRVLVSLLCPFSAFMRFSWCSTVRREGLSSRSDALRTTFLFAVKLFAHAFSRAEEGCLWQTRANLAEMIERCILCERLERTKAMTRWHCSPVFHRAFTEPDQAMS